MDPAYHEHDDDKPIGRLLTRRETLKLLGGLGVAAASVGIAGISMAQRTPTPTPTPTPTATPVPSCVVRPELTEGPFFVDEILHRSDIRIEPSDESIKEGTLLRLKFRVFDVSANTCAPLVGAQVDVWHCDAEGTYSGVQDRNAASDASDLIFLRGYQVTDEFGEATFVTIVPGWYRGRAVHIHFKIRTDPESNRGYEFTSQLFFDPEQISEIYEAEPYADKGEPDTSNLEDNIFQSSEDLLTLALTPYVDEETEEEGYEAWFDIGLEIS
jgi:protocatechuate 3,4-dioxygenase beta subunit